MPVPAVVQRIVSFLRAGYPEGIPPQDYIPLIALLSAHLGDDEVVALAGEIAATGLVADGSDAPSHAAVSQAIQALTKAAVLPEDVERVRERLESAGWQSDS